MKHLMHKLSGIIFLTFFLTLTSYAQTSANEDVILIRCFWKVVGKGKTDDNSYIKVYKGNNQVEKIQLKAVTADEDENNSLSALRDVLQKYISQGYSIASSHETSMMVYGEKYYSTYLLQKK